MAFTELFGGEPVGVETPGHRRAQLDHGYPVPDALASHRTDPWLDSTPAIRKPRPAARALHPDEELGLRELELRVDARAGVAWQYMKPIGRPSYTEGLLRDMKRAIGWVQDRCASDGTPDIRYLVLASRIPGIFNLGGDLPLFVELIREGKRDALRRYAHACIDVQHPRAVNLDLPLITISLVQGDALGGGFEAALADNIIVAEKSAKFGLPEILFNLFPGMGAYSFLSRRLDAVRAEKMILSGRIYTAQELHDMGVVDVVAEDGMGEPAVYDLMDCIDRNFDARRALYRTRQMVDPVTRDELIGITDLWVETTIALGDTALRKMERLAAAQDRRWSSLR